MTEKLLQHQRQNIQGHKDRKKRKRKNQQYTRRLSQRKYNLKNNNIKIGNKASYWNQNNKKNQQQQQISSFICGLRTFPVDYGS